MHYLFLKSHLLKRGNSCFINPNTFEQFENQLSFLQNIKRVSIEHLEGLYQKEISNSGDKGDNQKTKFTNLFGQYCKISRFGFTTDTHQFLKEELNFANTEFFVKKTIG